MCALISWGAYYVAAHFGWPLMMVCLLLGMIFHYLGRLKIFKDGIQFTSKTVLRIGIVFIGARIVFADFMALGWPVVVFIVIASFIVIALGVFLAKMLGMSRDVGLVFGGATAICGASAALAISSVLPASKENEQNTLLAIIGVTLVGTLSMIFSPFALSFLDISDYQAGVFIGGSIHDVAQVVGAGYSVSGEAGDIAVLVKMIRVFLLVPVLIVISLFFGGGNGSVSSGLRSKISFFPLFLLGFIALFTVNSLGFITAEASVSLSALSKYMLILAIAAVGVKTSFKGLWSLGAAPFILVSLEAMVIISLYLVAIFLII